jgi:hypothetical protein
MKKEKISKREEPIIKEVDEPDDDAAEDRSKPIDEKQKRSDEIRNLVIFLVVLMVCAGGAYLIYLKMFLPLKQGPGNQTESYEWNKFEFTKGINGLWKTEVQVGNRLITVPLHYGPREVWKIDIIGNLSHSFDEGPVYITFDPLKGNQNMTALAAGELSLNIVQGVEREVIAACAVNETIPCATRPIVDCRDTDKAVIFLLESNQTSVAEYGNCIVVRGNGLNLLKATDRLILYWYGVMGKVDRVEANVTVTPVRQ